MKTLRFGYVTNGLLCHRLDDALRMLADEGYAGVGLTLDHCHLDPFAPDLAARVESVRRLLEHLGLAVVVETGARFLLDARRKHEPTLMSEDRERRLNLLRLAVSIGADLGAEAVALWSGPSPSGIDGDEAWRRLVDGCLRVADAANDRAVRLAFEPEPGMLIDDLDGYERLLGAIDHPPGFDLTLDIGHCVCLEEDPVPVCIGRAGSRIANVHVEDMRRGVHEHLEFGRGELDLSAALAALKGVTYAGLVSVELSRHSHTAHTAVPEAIRVLREADCAEAVA